MTTTPIPLADSALVDAALPDAAAPNAVLANDVQALRRFNRFYTLHAGVLDPFLGGSISLTETRVLYELAHIPSNKAGLASSDIARTLGLDPGYLSRILKRFNEAGWTTGQPDPRDGRVTLLTLTDVGRTVYGPLYEKSNELAAKLLAPLSTTNRNQLLESMAVIERLLGPGNAVDSAPHVPIITLREFNKPGDIGWVVQQHGEVYNREYGWDNGCEVLAAEILNSFVTNFDASCERGWIAEKDGKRVGSIFVVRGSAPETAKIRLFLLTLDARGLGLGKRLTNEAVHFAREKGYKKVELWTHSCLIVARAIYARLGFKLTKSEPHYSFGSELLVGEYWELELEDV